jgi:uridine kinase
MDVTEAWRGLGEVHTSFAQVIQRAGLKIVGLGGAPGSGKSTFAREVVRKLGEDALALSMDDFYISKQDRAALGLGWRGAPGSHDLHALLDVLDAVRGSRTPLIVPKFSGVLDDRIDPVTIESAPSHVLVEGWVLGHRADGYEEILEHLDLLAFLDVHIAIAKQRRFQREAELRESGGGFSEADTQRFWDEVLEPGLDRWVKDAKAEADLVIELDASNQVRSVRTGSPVVMAVLAG